MIRTLDYSCKGGTIRVLTTITLGNKSSTTYTIGISDSKPDSEPHVRLSDLSAGQAQAIADLLTSALARE